MYKLCQPLIHMQEEQEGKRLQWEKSNGEEGAESSPVTQIGSFQKGETGEVTQDDF